MKSKKIENTATIQEDEVLTSLRRGYAHKIHFMIVSNQLPPNLVFSGLTDRTLLHVLVGNKNNDWLLHWLLENYLHELDLNVQDDGGFTPLMYAATAKNHTAIELLLAYGANSEIETYSYNNHKGEKFIDIIKIDDVNWEEQANHLINRAKMGTLPKPSLIMPPYFIPQKQGPVSKTTQNTITTTGQPKKPLSFSLRDLIEKVKSPIFSQRFKKLPPEAQPLTRHKLKIQ